MILPYTVCSAQLLITRIVIRCFHIYNLETTSYLIITGQQSSLVREDSNTNSEIEPVEKEDTDNLPTKKEVKHKETPARRILYAGYVHSSSGGTKKVRILIVY